MRPTILFALLFSAVLPAHAEPLTPFRQGLLERLIFTETFDTATKQALGGVLSARVEAPWTVSFEGGAARFVNDTDNSAVRYVSLDAMQFGGVRSQTDGAEERVSVKVVDTQNGGAGIVMGYTGGGDYLVFALSSRDQYSILEKADGKVSRLTVGENAAIHPDQFNALSVSQDAGHFDFLVNGVKVFEIDRPKLTGAPIGIAVFGKGDYLFDRVDVVPPASILDILAAQARNCDFPSIDKADAVMLAGVPKAAAVSSVSLVGQDAETRAVSVDVTSGEQPIYIIGLQTGEPTVWQFAGDVDRIAGVLLLTTDKAVVGVAGLDGKRLTVKPARACIQQLSQPRSQQSAYVMTALGLGRDLDSFAIGNIVGSISAPNGRPGGSDDNVEAVGLPVHANARLLDEALRLDPGGVLHVDPATVISDHPVEPYEVVPGQWGLVQLMGEGKLVAEQHDRMDNFQRFRIVQPMRFPADLTGSGQVIFVLPSDVPMPTGNPGHSQVIRESPPGPWVPWSMLGR